MSESRGAATAPPAVRNRIRDDDSKLVERLAVLLLAFWMGGMLMVTLSATGSFRAVESSMDKPPQRVAQAMAKLGVAETRDLLHHQSSEVNRLLFEVWGWTQLSLTSAVFAALLFMTNAGRKVLILSGGCCGMSAVVAFFLIPGMIRVGRELPAHTPGPVSEMRQAFQRMHAAFGAFEAAALLLGLFLLVTLLRGGARSRR